VPAIVPNLWFDRNGLEAAEFYVSIFPNSEIRAVSHYPEATPDRGGEVLTVDFVLDGTAFTAINGGPQFTFDEAISFLVECADQAEIDRFWDALLADGGQESQCGWLKDRFGVSWQVVPSGFAEIMTDPVRGPKAFAAVMGMVKLDIAAIEAAADA
jgi:predicted 3-demethylubiquinone-9 3-methyltransferase (glyoxalase superfamily)